MKRFALNTLPFPLLSPQRQGAPLPPVWPGDALVPRGPGRGTSARRGHDQERDESEGQEGAARRGRAEAGVIEGV